LQLGLERFQYISLNKIYFVKIKVAIQYAALINMSVNVRPWLRYWHDFWLSKKFRLDIAALYPEHYIQFIWLRPDGPQNTHTQTIILLRLKIFQYDFKGNTFAKGVRKGKGLGLETPLSF